MIVILGMLLKYEGIDRVASSQVIVDQHVLLFSYVSKAIFHKMIVHTVEVFAKCGCAFIEMPSSRVFR